MATDRGAPDTEGPRQQTAMIGRFSGFRIVLLTAPSPQNCLMLQRHYPSSANGSLRRSSPITAAGPRWILTTLPSLVRRSGHRNRELFNCQSAKLFTCARKSPTKRPRRQHRLTRNAVRWTKSRLACWTRAPWASGTAIGGGACPRGASPRRVAQVAPATWGYDSSTSQHQAAHAP
jgi:hypothetical protein